MKSIFVLTMILLLSFSVFGSSTGYDLPSAFLDDLTPTHERITNEALKLFCEKEGVPEWNETFGVLLDRPTSRCNDFNLTNGQMDYEELDSLYPNSPVRSIILGSRYPDLFEYPGLYYQAKDVENADKEYKEKFREWALDELGFDFDLLKELDLGTEALYGYYHAQINTRSDKRNGELVVRILNDFIRHTLMETQAISFYRDRVDINGSRINEGQNKINAYYTYCQDAPWLCDESLIGLNISKVLLGVLALGDVVITGGILSPAGLTALVGADIVTSLRSSGQQHVYEADWTKVSLGILFHAIADSFAHDLRFRKCENGSCKMVIAAPINSEFESGWGFNHNNGIKNKNYDDLRREILIEYFSGNEQKVENLENEDIENYNNYKNNQENPDILRTFDFNPCLLIDGEKVNSIISYCYCMILNYDEYDESNFINSVKTFIDKPEYFNPFVSGMGAGTADQEGFNLEYYDEYELPDTLPISIANIPNYFFWKGTALWGTSEDDWLTKEAASSVAKYATAEFIQILKYALDNPLNYNELDLKIKDYLEKWFSYDSGTFTPLISGSDYPGYDGFAWYNYHAVDLYDLHEENVDFLTLPWDPEPTSETDENDGYRFLVKLNNTREAYYSSAEKTFYASRGVVTLFRTWNSSRMEYGSNNYININLEEVDNNGEYVYKKANNDYHGNKYGYSVTEMNLDEQFAFAFIPQGYALCFIFTPEYGAGQIVFERCHYGGEEGKTAYFNEFHIKGSTVNFYDSEGVKHEYSSNNSKIVIFPVDADLDGIPFVMDVDKQMDNCPFHYNPDQQDTDNNGIGDACDDRDDDGVFDSEDICPGYYDNIDYNGNDIPDGCDKFPFDKGDDLDGDEIIDIFDNCAPIKEELESLDLSQRRQYLLKFKNPVETAPLKEITFAPYPVATVTERIGLYLCKDGESCISSGLIGNNTLGIRLWAKMKRSRNKKNDNYAYVPIMPDFLYSLWMEGKAYDIEWPERLDQCRTMNTGDNKKDCIIKAVEYLLRTNQIDLVWQSDSDLDGVGDKCDDSTKSSKIKHVEEYSKEECHFTAGFRECSYWGGDIIDLDVGIKGALKESVVNEVYYCNVSSSDLWRWGDPGYCTRIRNDYEINNEYWDSEPVYNFGFSHATDPKPVNDRGEPIWNPVTRVYSLAQAEQEYQKELAIWRNSSNNQVRSISPSISDFPQLKDLSAPFFVIGLDATKLMWSWRSDYCKYNAIYDYECAELSSRKETKLAKPFHYTLSSGVVNGYSSEYIIEDYGDTIHNKKMINPDHFFNSSIFARADRYSSGYQTAKLYYGTSRLKLIDDIENDYNLIRPPFIDDILPEELGSEWVKRRIRDLRGDFENGFEMVYKKLIGNSITVVKTGDGIYYSVVKEINATATATYSIYKGTENDENDWIKVGEIENLPIGFEVLSAVYFKESILLVLKTESAEAVLHSVPVKKESLTAEIIANIESFKKGKLYVRSGSLYSVSESDGDLLVSKAVITGNGDELEFIPIQTTDTVDFRYFPTFTEMDGKIYIAGGFSNDGSQVNDVQVLNHKNENLEWETLSLPVGFNLNEAFVKKNGNQILFFDSSVPENDAILSLSLNVDNNEIFIEKIVIDNPHFASVDFEQCRTFVDGVMYPGIISGGVCLPVMIGSEGTFDTGKTNYAVAGNNDAIYVAQGNGFEVFKAKTMTKIGSRSLYGPVKDLVVKGTKLFAAAGNGIDVFDISAKENPVLTKHIATYGDTTSFDIEGNDLYVGDGQGIKVFDTETLTLKKQKNTSGDTEVLEYFNGKVFVYEWSGFRVYDAVTMDRLYSNGFYCNDPKLRSDEENAYLACGNYVRRIEWNYSLTTVSGKKESFQRGHAFENILYLPDAKKITSSIIGIAPVPVCGNGIVETGEKCDKNTIQCTTLSSDYISGTATCNSTCSGYNQSGCEEDDGWGGSSSGGSSGDDDGW